MNTPRIVSLAAALMLMLTTARSLGSACGEPAGRTISSASGPKLWQSGPASVAALASYLASDRPGVVVLVVAPTEL
jgi:hypothetical protein